MRRKRKSTHTRPSHRLSRADCRIKDYWEVNAGPKDRQSIAMRVSAWLTIDNQRKARRAGSTRTTTVGPSGLFADPKCETTPLRTWLLNVGASRLIKCTPRRLRTTEPHEATRNTSSKTLASLAVPDFLLAALLPSLHARPSRNFLRVTGRSFLNVAPFVLCDLGQRTTSED